MKCNRCGIETTNVFGLCDPCCRDLNYDAVQESLDELRGERLEIDDEDDDL